jgi:hypothetical protein
VSTCFLNGPITMEISTNAQMRNRDYHITMCTSVHVFASANAIISTKPYEHGQMSGGAVCSTSKARHGPRAQQDSDGKLTGEGSHGCRSTGPDTLVGGELMVLERLNEPSVAGWLRERVMPTQQASRTSSSEYYQPRAKSPAHAHRNLTSLFLSL